MPLFKLSGKQLSSIKELPFTLEKELQALTEANLEGLFGLEFVTSEFERDGLRIDTLAFDPDSGAFVIIEYKREQSFSVVDQGFAYLSLMLNNKEVFLVEYNERLSKSLKREAIDWSQSKVIFIARGFTNYQQAASGFKDLPIELWQVTRYDGGYVLYDRIQTKKSNASIKTIQVTKANEEVVKQVKTYTEADIVPKEGNTRVLYEEFRDRVLALDTGLRPHVTKAYIAFRHGEDWRNIVSVNFRSNKLRIDFQRTKPSDLNDPENRLTYQKGSMEHWSQNISNMDMVDRKDLDYAIYLAQQAIERYHNSITKA